MTRRLFVQGMLYDVPKFIHRNYANGGGWGIALPGVRCCFEDADGGADVALEKAKAVLGDVLALRVEALMEHCALQVRVMGAGQDRMLSVESAHNHGVHHIGMVPLSSERGYATWLSGAQPLTKTAVRDTLGDRLHNEVLNLWRNYLMDYIKSQPKATQAPVVERRQLHAQVQHTKAPDTRRMWWHEY